MTGDPLQALEARVLLLAPTARDAEICGQVLAGAGISTAACGTIGEVCEELARGAAAAILTEEAIASDREGCLASFLAGQPPWSDLPLIVLTPAGPAASARARELRAIGPMTLMKRPIPLAELVSVVESALRDRRRQYQSRDLLRERERQARALQESEVRYRQVADNIPNGFIYQIAHEAPGRTRFAYVSAGVKRIVGVRPDEVTADPMALYGSILDEDRPRVREEEEAALRDWTPFDCQFRMRGRTGEIRWLHCRSAPRPLPGGGSVWDGIALDVTERKRAEERQALLGDVGQILGSSLDYEATLANLCDLVVPVFSDWCALDLLTDGGEVRRLAIAHKDPARLALAEEFRRRYPPRPDDEGGLMHVLRGGEPILLPELTEEQIVRGSRDPEHLALIRALGLHSFMIVPLVARGRTLGAMTLATAESARRFGEDDLQLALELASRAALAVDNARLFSEGQEAARRREEALELHRDVEKQLTLLVEASGSLSESPDLQSVLAAILDLSSRLVAADAYAVWRLAAGSGQWGIVFSSGLSEEYQRVTIRVFDESPAMTDGPLIAEDVLAAPSLGERERAYEREGIRSLLAAPLNVRGQISGTLVFYFRRPHRFTQVEIRVATALSNLAASAIGTAELYEELKANDRRKDEFLAMLAHELRNPLAAVNNAVTVLKMSADAENRAWASDVVERQVGQLSRLIDDLLDVSRITSGKIRLRMQRVDAAPILDQAVESARPLIDVRKHHLSVSVERGALPLQADPTRLEQIVVNLLNNAAKYTPSGGRIWLDARREGDDAVISIRDDGMGIAPEKLPEMFQLFAQGERSIARSEGGLGIGLTIVKKLAEMHGGTVSATSHGPGQGSEFTIRLPCAAPAGGAAVESAIAPKAKRMGSRILVVDDSVDTARGMVRLLKLLGNEVRVAHDGPTGLEIAREFRPDHVLLDIGLPGMDGFEVASRLRSDVGCGDAVIIAVSGYGQDEDRRRSRAAGFDHHLIKPVDFDALVSLLGRS